MADGTELLILQEQIAHFGDSYTATHGRWVALVTYALHKPTMRFTKSSNLLAALNAPDDQFQPVNDGFDPGKKSLSNDRYFGRCSTIPDGATD